MWSKINRFYPSSIEISVWIIIFLTGIYMLHSFPGLPDQIPRHYNFAGEPDAWSGRGMIIGLYILQVFSYFMLWMLNFFLIINSEDNKDSLLFINIPFIDKEALKSEQIILVKKQTARMMASLNWVITLMFSYLIIGTIQTAHGVMTGLGYGVLLFILLSLAPIIYYSYKLYQFSKEIEKAK